MTKLLLLIILSICFINQAYSIDRCNLLIDNHYKKVEKLKEQFSKNDINNIYIEMHMLSVYQQRIFSECNMTFFQMPRKFTTCENQLQNIQKAIYRDTNSTKLDFYEIQDQISLFNKHCTPYDFKDSLLFKSNLQNSNGMNCAVCGLLVTLIERFLEYQKMNITEFLAEKVICKWFPTEMIKTCEQVVEFIGNLAIEDFVKKQNSDVICQKTTLCIGYEQCRLHGKPDQQSFSPKKTFLQIYKEEQLGYGANPWDWIIVWIQRFSDGHEPLFDIDEDGFSDYPTFRGYNWRGYDCHDHSSSIYPGRRVPPAGLENEDYNCNGTMLIGDSAGAHFEIPARWVNVSEWGQNTFQDFFDRLSNELDVPQKSSGTGWVNSSDVDSGYLFNVKQDRCNRGDYQNYGVNGARSSNVMNNLKYLHRLGERDHPVQLAFELVGNDVCNGHPGTDHMTTPEEFHENIMKVFRYLDTKLPKGSHMTITGIADGRVLYDLLAKREHPIGGITYSTLYDFLNCVEISPCWGWCNSNGTARNLTTQRAMELNEVYKQIIKEEKFENFDMIYYDVPQDDIIKRAVEMGYQPYDIIEPVDGFHPSQLANKIEAIIAIENLERDRPDWIPKENPLNSEIDEKFPFKYPPN